MSRRLVYVAFGAAVGVLVVRKASQAAARFTPAGVQSSLAGSLAGLTEAIRDFSADLREAMSEREEELRVTLGLDGTHDLVDLDPGHTGGLEPDVR
ncbi:MAG: putative secreted protein [Frankiales bacterium]|nr:putative secreted protein [Frankiales bacterium]